MPSVAVLEQKKKLVADLTAEIAESCTGVVVDYKGISVADDTKLRKELREAGVEYAVVEVGLGGRFDSTNVITPVISMIAAIFSIGRSSI